MRFLKWKYLVFGAVSIVFLEFFNNLLWKQNYYINTMELCFIIIKDNYKDNFICDSSIFLTHIPTD